MADDDAWEMLSGPESETGARSKRLRESHKSQTMPTRFWNDPERKGGLIISQEGCNTRAHTNPASNGSFCFVIGEG